MLCFCWSSVPYLSAPLVGNTNTTMDQISLHNRTMPEILGMLCVYVCLSCLCTSPPPPSYLPKWNPRKEGISVSLSFVGRLARDIKTRGDRCTCTSWRSRGGHSQSKRRTCVYFLCGQRLCGFEILLCTKAVAVSEELGLEDAAGARELKDQRPTRGCCCIFLSGSVQ